jgi:sec-independent protein translocase protein TatA
MIEGLFAPMHLLIIGGIALLVFGPSRLPELGRGFGQAIRSFKAGLEEVGARSQPAPPQLAAETRPRINPAGGTQDVAIERRTPRSYHPSGAQ